MAEHVEFVSYTGKYPNLCTGDLTLKIDGVVEYFRYDRRAFWRIDNYMPNNPHNSRWTVNLRELPVKYQKYRNEIEEVMNNEMPRPCCGGCT